MKRMWSNKTDEEMSEINDKKVNSYLINFGCTHPSKSVEIKDKIKETNIERYDVDNVFKSEEIKEKIKQTNLDKYGVEYYSQSENFHKTKLSRYRYDNISFDSSYELCFYKFCKDRNLNIIRNTEFLVYFYNGIEHHYFPDFKINNRYIEIKGLHFFENNKLINPYDRNQDDFYEAKYQCMIDNNVIIISNCDKYIQYVQDIDENFISLHKITN